MIELRELVEAAARLQERWAAEGHPFCFIGGLAVQRWGEPRYTRHVDACLFVGFGGEREAIDRNLARLRPRLADAAEFALINRVLLVEDASGCPIDISLGAMPYEQDVISRSTQEPLTQDGPCLRICGPSDLIVLKAFAGRPQDWQDIRSVIVRSGKRLDWDLINIELKTLVDLKEEPETLDQLAALRQQLEG